MSLPVASVRNLVRVALAVTLCLPGVEASARQGSGAIRVRATAIQGSAWHADNTPIPKAPLRLRNVVTGRIDATATADDAGRFAFHGLPEGTYLVELVSAGGKVLAVGHVFTVARGETVATFVRLGAKIPWFHGFFGNAAVAVAASAAAAGVAAMAPDMITSVSPNR